MATFIASGRDYVLNNVAVDTNDTAITVSKACKFFILQNRTSEDVQIRRNSGDTNYFTIKGGGAMSIEAAMGTQDGVTVTIGYAKVAAGSITLEILCVF